MIIMQLDDYLFFLDYSIFFFSQFKLTVRFLLFFIRELVRVIQYSVLPQITKQKILNRDRSSISPRLFEEKWQNNILFAFFFLFLLVSPILFCSIPDFISL